MFSELNIKGLMEVLYNTPLEYFLYYYFILFMVGGIIKKVIDVEVGTDIDFGIFKFDKKSLPILLLISWFGLIYKFIKYFDKFESKIFLTLFCILIFIVFIIFFKKIQIYIQKKIIARFYKQKKRLEIDFPYIQKQINYYIEDSDIKYTYNNIFMIIMLSLFCIIFSLLKFNLYPTIILIIILFIYWYKVGIWQINYLKEDLDRR